MNKDAVTAQEMKEMEFRAFQKGIPYLTMMENAGTAAFDVITSSFSLRGKVVIVMVGKGNNGGDGYVVARLLKQAGIMTIVLMVEGNPVTDDAKENLSRCLLEGIEVLAYDPKTADFLLDGADFIIDAVYGAGFHGSLRDTVRPALQKINKADAKVIALDLPSGLNADTGEFDRDAVKATMTVVFAKKKIAHTKPEALSLCGKIVIVDIGI